MFNRIYEPTPENHGRDEWLSIALEVAEISGWIDGEWPEDDWNGYHPYDVRATTDDGSKRISLFAIYRVDEGGTLSEWKTDLGRCVATFTLSELNALRNGGVNSHV